MARHYITLDNLPSLEPYVSTPRAGRRTEPSYADGFTKCAFCRQAIPRGTSKLRMVNGQIIHFCGRCDNGSK